MKIENNKVLKIKLKGSEADDFKTAITKIQSKNGSIGFNRADFSDGEKKVLKDISEKLA